MGKASLVMTVTLLILRKMNESVVTLSSFCTDLLYAGSKWQQLVAHLQRLVKPFHRSELAYKEGKGELFRPGWLAWAAETSR